MSWIRTVNGNLINLEHVEAINVTEYTDDTADVMAVTGRDTEGEMTGPILKEGNVAECNAFRDAVATKLPMVRI